MKIKGCPFCLSHAVGAEVKIPNKKIKCHCFTCKQAFFIVLTYRT